MLAEACGVLSRIFAEGVREIKWIRISAKLRYFRNAVIGIYQKMLRVSQTNVNEILRRCCVKLLLEFPYERGMAQIDPRGEKIDIYFLIKMLVEISNSI